jgi:hypothetical protein
MRGAISPPPYAFMARCLVKHRDILCLCYNNMKTIGLILMYMCSNKYVIVFQNILCICACARARARMYVCM